MTGMEIDATRDAPVALSLSDAAPALRERAVRIRRQLGAWPAPARQWQIVPAARVSAASAPSARPLCRMIVDDGMQDAIVRATWLAQGAAVLAVTPGAGSESECQARLDWNGLSYTLAGHPEPDWEAALAAFLDCGCEPEDALCLAWGWSEAGSAGRNDGDDAWPNQPLRMPRVLGLPAPPANPGFAACPRSLGLYPLVTSADWVARLLDLGVRTVQLRIKAASEVERVAMEREIVRAVELGRAYDARVFINDHWRIALATGAYGVHLGQEDLRTADLDAIARGGLRLGLSTHGIYEMLLAWHFRPSYLAFGAVFPTQTKQLASHPQGLARLARFVALFGDSVPTVAIGGIDLARLPQVLATGVGGAAVVRAITEAPDTAEAVASLQNAFEDVVEHVNGKDDGKVSGKVGQRAHARHVPSA